MSEPLEPIPISALQHWSYCPRQCALIHLEQVFTENVHTLRGQAVHARVDTPGFEVRRGCRAERSLPLWSERLGLIGKADIVEFQSDGVPYPVEYKHGRLGASRKKHAHDELQLAAQALCLEEMTGHAVHEGAIYQASSHKRRVVPITSDLRHRVLTAVAEVRNMLVTGEMPPPLMDDAPCKQCSLFETCQPQAIRQMKTLSRHALFDPEGE
jgi:CRISPR-associated exonuclease Cas4